MPSSCSRRSRVGLAAASACSASRRVGTLFLVVTLWIIEGFETRVRTFLLTVEAR